jgi:hypothetical protein
LFLGLEDNKARFNKALDVLQNKDDNPHLSTDAKKKTLGDIEKIKKEIRDASPDDHLRRILVKSIHRDNYIATA